MLLIDVAFHSEGWLSPKFFVNISRRSFMSKCDYAESVKIEESKIGVVFEVIKDHVERSCAS